MKKLSCFLIVFLCLTTLSFAFEAQLQTYGEQTIEMSEVEEGVLLLEIVIPQDNIIFRHYTSSNFAKHLEQSFQGWDKRIMLGLSVKRTIMDTYEDYSNAAFDFGEDISDFINRQKEDDYTVYIFDMYKSEFYTDFFIETTLF